MAPLRAIKNTLQHIVKMDSKNIKKCTEIKLIIVAWQEVQDSTLSWMVEEGGRECECEEYFTVSQLSQN